MPRPIRTFSEHNLYHVVLKSINSQTIFESDGDCKFFLDTFIECCNSYGASIYAYCLMSNHIHLLLHFKDNNLSALFKAFGAKYVPKYNFRHNRTGSLFKGRYYSKPINDDTYFLSVVRYIHNNPVKACLCDKPDQYEWSSFREYKEGYKRYTETSFLMSIIDFNQFEELHRRDNIIEDFIIENSINPYSYEELVEKSEYLSEKYSVDEIITAMKQSGLSKSTISKVLSIDKRKM